VPKQWPRIAVLRFGHGALVAEVSPASVLDASALAALLHDALEDQYRESLPAGLSWRSRKERYIENLTGASEEVVRVSLADKLANVRSMLRKSHRDYRSLAARSSVSRR
jgi:(p)ppGpp synthase/HD superfamily hydrolase